MTTTFRVKGMGALMPLMKRHMKKRQDRVHKAIRIAAHKGAAHVRRNCPVAFSELRDSVHATTAGRLSGHSRIIADAPHAAAVEVGSRPHWAPLEPLIQWVKLRGFQGLVSEPKMKRLPGTTTREHAQSIATSITAMGNDDGSVDINTPEQIARAIQATIAKFGTKPQWYMRNAIPTVVDALDVAIRKALPEVVDR